MALSNAEIDAFERHCLIPWANAIEVSIEGSHAQPRVMGAGPRLGIHVTADRSDSAQHQYSFNVFVYWPDGEVSALLTRERRASVISSVNNRLPNHLLAIASQRGCDVDGRSQAAATVFYIELDDFDF
ncbi:DUF5594 family protein [Burkholderia seminalis]|uniref:DUF5594 family protein n=1 Tax=Burkholderia seminalis TaxID=488731 RepID=UPI00158D3A62|nr:DUF5594 family protein [Burkholderia seminalis]